MDVPGLASALREEAAETNQRRLLVLAGDRDVGLGAACEALEAADLREEVTFVTTRRGDGLPAAARVESGRGLRYECVPPERSATLLGTTRKAVVLDAHEGFSPNVLGRLVGTVSGGGLLVLVVPPLAEWPERRDDFDERLAVPPFEVEDVDGRFRSRLVRTLRSHHGVALVDVDAGEIERDGVVDRTPPPTSRPTPPGDAAFPSAAYEACLTGDQARAVRALERLRDPGHAVVVEADRGRGKSAAAGIAAGCLAAEGRDVLVTAPSRSSAREVFVRARSLLEALDARGGDGTDGDEVTGDVETSTGGRVRFADPPVAADLPDDPDAVVVDEAAALPVALLSRFLDASSVAFVTTVHGYEGAGRGFSVRFRDRLAESDLTVRTETLRAPIRYAGDDPVESWAFRALVLDATPPVTPLVEDATVETTTYRALSGEELLADDHLLSETFGLLVLAHYRTEPDDLARLLDAPNLAVRALLFDGHVVGVALLAREGGLSAETRREMYEGARIRGNMLPDVMTSQLRDERAGVPVGQRVMRIATHPAVRSRGLGSRLLAEIYREFSDEVDWLGTGYGATPDLVRFWRENGYRTVHLSTTRNATSGEYSALMLRPTSETGRALADRHGRWFRWRALGVLSDALSDLDPDVARATLAATGGEADPALSAHEWRVVAGAAYGPGLYAAAPDAFRRLALAHFVDGETTLPSRAERLLVRKVLQGDPWDEVASDLEYVSTSECMRALGEAYRPLVDHYGSEVALAERDRYRD